jgi:cytosine/adenosine deaminase-related metal-dependent hydrolase
MVMPGLIDVHSHPCLEASYRGIREEHGVPEMYMSGLFERAGAYWPDDEGKLACAEAAYCELLRSGVTTLVDISGRLPGLAGADRPQRAPRRARPLYASSRWVVRRSHLLEYEWNEAPAARRSRRPCGSATTWPSIRAGACPA